MYSLCLPNRPHPVCRHWWWRCGLLVLYKIFSIHLSPKEQQTPQLKTQQMAMRIEYLRVKMQ
jgi:hypothetical protein